MRPCWSVRSSLRSHVKMLMPGGKTVRVLGALGVICVAGVAWGTGVLDAVLQVPFRWFADSVLGMFEGFVDSTPDTETG